MTDKRASRFFSIQFAAFGTALLTCAVAWPVGHIINGTLNFPSLIFSVVMLAGAIHLFKHGWQDLRNDFKKESTTKANTK